MSTFGKHKFKALGTTDSLYTFFLKMRNISFDIEQTLTLASCTFFFRISLP